MHAVIFEKLAHFKPELVPLFCFAGLRNEEID
jgi:hypothetical protein